jgi:hypothetical protein
MKSDEAVAFSSEHSPWRATVELAGRWVISQEVCWDADRGRSSEDWEDER